MSRSSVVSIIESVPASTGCAIGLGKEHEWVVRMIQAEVPRMPLARGSASRAGARNR
jgi:hypothetical protein